MIILGIIIGLLLAIIVFLATKKYQAPVERILKQAENFTKEKGEVFLPNEEKDDLDAWLGNLPKE